jgi:uncharacterized protein
LPAAARVDTGELAPIGTRERHALRLFLRRARAPGAPPLVRAILFGSRARGDHHPGSDVDLLLWCALPEQQRSAAAAWHAGLAEHVAGVSGVDLQPWTLTLPELRAGRRTPMLVDALEDGVTIWPAGAPDLVLPFGAADARFCAACLFDWIADGGRLVARRLRRGDWEGAARRTRDDIVRLATAPLLLVGHTRHRRRGSLRTFDRLFVQEGRVSEHVRPALYWAAGAFPGNGRSEGEEPPASRAAVRTAPEGFRYAARMSAAVLPLVDALLLQTTSGASLPSAPPGAS